MTRLASLLCCALLLASAGGLAVPAPLTAVAHAADDDDEDAAAQRKARKHYNKAEKLFALGRFDEALVEYEAAFDAYPAPAFLFNIGQCHRNLGNLDEAIFSFRKYLSLEPEAENRDAVEALIKELEAEKQRRDGQKIIGPEPPDKPVPGRKPIYKKWWFWTGVAVVAGGVTVLVLSQEGGLPDSDLGNIDFGR